MAAVAPRSAMALGGAVAAAACLCGARRCATLSSAGGGSAGFELASVGLVALDLDGTLCHSDGTVSARNRAALAALRREGVTVVMATGRPGSSAKSLPALVDNEVDYVIVSNGGETYCAQGGGWRNVSSFPMASVDVSSIVTRLEERMPASFHLAVTMSQGMNCHSFRSFSEFIIRVPPSGRKRYAAMDTSNPPPNMCFVDSVGSFAEQPSVVSNGAEALSILLWSEDCENPHELQESVNGHIGDLVAASDPPVRCELAGLPGMIAIMSEAAGNKSVALETLRNELRLSSAGTIAFGDGLNDCAMLEWAGCGWSMLNAEDPAVTQAADKEAQHHDEDGVGIVLEQVLAAKANAALP